MSVDEVVADVEARGCPTVEVTGGEPLLQPDVYPLMQRLLDSGKTVLIETGGHRSIADVPAGVIRIMDVKCPGSGESDKNDWSNLAHLTKHGRSEVRDRRSRATTSSRRRSSQREQLAGARQRGAVLAGAWRARSEAAVRMGDRRSARRARAAAGAQVHLESGDAWRLTGAGSRSFFSAAGSIPTPRRPSRSATASRCTRSASTTASVTSQELEASRAVAQALGVQRHLELDLDLTRIGGSALTSDQIDVPKDQPIDPARHSQHLRAGAQHDLPVGRDGLGRSARRVRHLHRRQRARLLRLSRLPARVHSRVRAAGAPGDEGRRRRPAADGPHAADRAVEGGHHPARPVARPRLRPDAQLLRPAARRPALRPLRQLPAARRRVCRSRCNRPANSAPRRQADTIRAEPGPHWPSRSDARSFSPSSILTILVYLRDRLRRAADLRRARAPACRRDRRRWRRRWSCMSIATSRPRMRWRPRPRGIRACARSIRKRPPKCCCRCWTGATSCCTTR